MNTIELQSIVFIYMVYAVFQTAHQARHPVLSNAVGEDKDVWTHVNLISNAPWFYASYVEPTISRSGIVETILLSSVDQVTQLFSEHGAPIEVHELMLVSPASFNRTDGWRMEPLQEIWRGQIGQSNDFGYLYCVTGGKRYFDGPELLKPADLNDLTRVVAFQPKTSSLPSAQPRHLHERLQITPVSTDRALTLTLGISLQQWRP